MISLRKSKVGCPVDRQREFSDSVVFQVDGFSRGMKSDSKTVGIKIQKME